MFPGPKRQTQRERDRDRDTESCSAATLYERSSDLYSRNTASWRQLYRKETKGLSNLTSFSFFPSFDFQLNPTRKQSHEQPLMWSIQGQYSRQRVGWRRGRVDLFGLKEQTEIFCHSSQQAFYQPPGIQLANTMLPRSIQFLLTIFHSSQRLDMY